MNCDSFGYPPTCCRGRGALNIRPYYHERDCLRVMLIGQDPNIRNQADKVHTVLMLDRPNNPLARWIQDCIFGGEFDRPTIYATNLVKCRLDEAPSRTPSPEGYLRPYFTVCKETLRLEIQRFRPQIVITFGQPAMRLFRECMHPKDADAIPGTMRRAFTGTAYCKVSAFDVTFDYVPCVHMNTANRHKDVYGEPLRRFRDYLQSRIRESCF